MKKQAFVLLPEHIALLKGFYVRWDESCYGAPAIDSKRPYGNKGRSAILLDIARILGIEPIKDMDDEETLTREQAEHCEKLHWETETALQIILRNGTFEPGTYQSTNYGITWTKVD